MNRPPSIVTFERLYLGSFAVWVAGLILFWAQFQHNIEVAAAHQPASFARIFTGAVDGMLALVAIVTLLLWYLVARRASLAAAWVVVITEAFGALSLVFTLFNRVRAGAGYEASGYVSMVATILAVAAAVFLWRADAQVWLKGARAAQPVDGL